MIIALVILLTLIYIILAVIAPAKRRREILSENPGQGVIIKGGEELFSLLRERTFLEARLSLSSGDSAGLVVNLSDSTLTLELKGVALHVAHPEKIKTGNYFKTLTEPEYIGEFAKVHKAATGKATIKKLPITVVEAPRDTSLVNSGMFIPDTTFHRAINATFVLDNGLVLQLVDVNSTAAGRFIRDTGSRIVSFTGQLWYMMRFRVPEYHPVIKVYLDGGEIRTLYRALPEKGGVVVRM